jgi:hypothetical protein
MLICKTAILNAKVESCLDVVKTAKCILNFKVSSEGSSSPFPLENHKIEK